MRLRTVKPPSARLKLHRDAPLRELYVVHSDREELEITERAFPGLRTAE